MITLTIINYALVRESGKWYRYTNGIVNYADTNIPKEIVQFETEAELEEYIATNGIEVADEETN